MQRRTFLNLSVAAGALHLSACSPHTQRSLPDTLQGGYAYETHTLGHKLKTSTDWPSPSQYIRCETIIAGGGIAGLAAARQLDAAKAHDYLLLEMADQTGGNARAGQLHGIAHPIGAHYLPTPNPKVPNTAAILELLESLGIAQYKGMQWHYDERMLCQQPQERLYFRDAWQEGLLPMTDITEQTLEQYRRFHAHIAKWQAHHAFGIGQLGQVNQSMVHLYTQSWSQYLASHQFNDPHLLWYLDYCCRDDYGAGIHSVNAWAGIHYFASRHGFSVSAQDTPQTAVLTWPQGNACLSAALTKPILNRLLTQRLIVRIQAQRHGVLVDVWNAALQVIERYEAKHCIVALPAFIAAKVVINPSTALLKQAQRIAYAAWTVSNVYVKNALRDGWGTANELAWDNVIYGSASLGYVNAGHQTISQYAGPTVLTHYTAHGVDAASRQSLLNQPWQNTAKTVMAELARVHPDIYRVATDIHITRYGHAMACPVVGALPQTAPSQQRLSFAHSDWAGYSVFEEAYLQGLRAAAQTVKAIRNTSK